MSLSRWTQTDLEACFEFCHFLPDMRDMVARHVQYTMYKYVYIGYRFPIYILLVPYFSVSQCTAHIQILQMQLTTPSQTRPQNLALLDVGLHHEVHVLQDRNFHLATHLLKTHEPPLSMGVCRFWAACGPRTKSPIARIAKPWRPARGNSGAEWASDSWKVNTYDSYGWAL